MSLFEPAPLSDAAISAAQPLAERMRPRTLDEYAGQEPILGPGKPLRRQIEQDAITSLILWGPPGVGKTSLGSLIARLTSSEFLPFSAVLGSIKEIKEVMAHAARQRRVGRRTVVFVDEIHRFNKAQQDAFLPHVERGDVVLIGATTENPSFEVNAALLSRCKVYALQALSSEEMEQLLQRALRDEERGLGTLRLQVEDEVLAKIAAFANGDARSGYNLLELAASTAGEGGTISNAMLEDLLQHRTLLYDKQGEAHFNLISALHKSVRSSDVQAALYWLARMLAGGEDRMYLARRLVRMAIEDIGLADPRAMEQAIAAMQTVHFLGKPEGDQALAQIAIYLAMAPKSDAAYRALKAAQDEATNGPSYPIPMALRNAPTKPMRQWGYGEGYEHAHQNPDGVTAMACLPPELAGQRFYEPTDRGMEGRIKQRLQELEEWREREGKEPE